MMHIFRSRLEIIKQPLKFWKFFSEGKPQLKEVNTPCLYGKRQKNRELHYLILRLSTNLHYKITNAHDYS